MSEEKPLRVSQVFQGNYVQAGDLNGKTVDLEIASIAPPNTVKCEATRQPINKPILYFTRTKKGLILNNTNAKTIRTHHGDDMTKWIGKKISLFETATRFQRDVVPCLRVVKKKLELPK